MIKAAREFVDDNRGFEPGGQNAMPKGRVSPDAKISSRCAFAAPSGARSSVIASQRKL
jgi:hypothetical protein